MSKNMVIFKRISSCDSLYYINQFNTDVSLLTWHHIISNASTSKTFYTIIITGILVLRDWFLEKVLQLHQFTSSMSYCSIFCFCTWLCYYNLFLTSPRDKITTEKSMKTSSGSSIRRRSCPICINKPFYFDMSIWFMQ